MAAAPNDKKRVMDVAKPGKSAPSATTRPLIVNHGGMIIDPMVNADVKTAPVPSADGLNGKSGVVASKPRGAKILQPLSAKPAEAAKEDVPVEPEAIDVKSTTDENMADAAEPSETQSDEVNGATSAQEDSTADSEPTDETPQDEPEAEATDTPPVDDGAESKDDSDSENSAVVDAVVDQANIGKKQKEEDKELVARKELVSKLVEEKKYFIPIRQQNTTRSGRMTMVLVGLGVLVLLGGYAAIDLGMINPGFDVPFHLLKKKEVVTSVVTPAVTPAVTTPAPTQATTSAATPTTLDYADKELGVSFSYPSAWGDVAVKKQSGSTSGAAVTFTFSKQPLMRAGMFTKDYKEQGGKDGVCLFVGLVPGTTLASIKSQYADGDSNYNTATYKTTTKFLKNAADTLVYERFEAGQPDGIGGCSGVAVAAYRTFSAGTYTGIEFLWASPSTDKAVPVTEFSKYKATPDTYLSQSDRKDILAVVESAKAQ